MPIRPRPRRALRRRSDSCSLPSCLHRQGAWQASFPVSTIGCAAGSGRPLSLRREQVSWLPPNSSLFSYARPSPLAEAHALLERYGDGANLLAGGTDLVVELRNRSRRPEVVIDV